MATNSEIISFMELFSSLAIAECNKRIAAGKGFILPSVAMAQSALESDWGQAGIMKKANAFFGVKAGGSWTGKVYSAATWEVVQGEVHNITANFRAYDSPAESMADYYELTCSLSRYANGISYGTDRSKWLSAKETITALWKGGYASDELYVNKIMNTINGRDLTKYDALITGEGDLGSGDISLPTIKISVSKADFIVGQCGYDSKNQKWAWSSFARCITNGPNKVIKIATAGTYIFEGLPETASVTLAMLSDGDYSTRDITNGYSRYLKAGDEIVLNILYDTVDAMNSAADFTITAGQTTSKNENDVLAFFVKIE